MKKIVATVMSLVFAFGAGAALVGCGGNNEQVEGRLSIRYFYGGYGDEWLKDSIKNFYAQKKGVDPSEVKEGEDYVLYRTDSSLTGNQVNFLNSDDAPDILMVQGSYENYIGEALIENLADVYEAEVTKLDGTKIKVKDFMLPEVYNSTRRPLKYGKSDVYSWVMPWAATAFTLAYNETLLLDTVHTDAYTVAGLEVGSKWTKAPETVDELMAYFADVSAGDSGIAPFGWSENSESSTHLQFLIETWWAQIQGTDEAKIEGEGTYYDFYNFNDIDLLDQTGIQMGIDTLRSLIIKGYGTENPSYINSDTHEDGYVYNVDLATYNDRAQQGKYAVWVAGDYFENEYLDGNEDFTTKLMTLPLAKGADGVQTDKKLTYLNTQEAFYIPTKAMNKDLAKEFLAFMCNEAELLNYTKKTGGMRPFQYDPLALAPDYEWTEFQKSFFEIYKNEKIMKYPTNTEISEISPVYLYNKSSLNFFAGSTFSAIFNANTHKKTAATIMSEIKSGFTSQFNDWQNNIYPEYFELL